MPVEPETFGMVLRRLRGRAGLTQEQLAERAGLSVRAVRGLERGERQHPYPHTFRALGDALGLGKEELLALQLTVPPRGARPLRAEATAPPEPRAGIPPDPAPHFLGRDGELAALRIQLRRYRRVAVHGLGGIGKTQLAAQYVHRWYSGYIDGCFWLRADQATSLVSDLAGLAWRLRLPERHLPEQERQVVAVLDWLRKRKKWLLVLDNVEQGTGAALHHWLPPGLPGHMVATSRAPMWTARLCLDPLLEAVVGPEEIITAIGLNNLGTALYMQHDLTEARLKYERALAIRRKLLDPEHHDIANSLNNLANVLRDLGEYVSAQTLSDAALDMRLRVLGSEHLDTAASLNDLGWLLHMRGKSTEARPLLESALAIRTKSLGPDHWRTRESRQYLAAAVHVQRAR